MVTLNRLSSISIPSPYTIEGFRNEGHALFFVCSEKQLLCFLLKVDNHYDCHAISLRCFRSTSSINLSLLFWGYFPRLYF